MGLRYDGAAPALSEIDLEVQAGSTVALVGPTGSGKTSLVALLARLYDPTEGEIHVDGAELRSVDVSSLRRQIAFVADDPFLFSASVAENIAYGRPDATRTRSSSRRGGRRRTSSSRPCPRAMRRSSASAGSRSPAVSANGSRSPGR